MPFICRWVYRAIRWVTHRMQSMNRFNIATSRVHMTWRPLALSSLALLVGCGSDRTSRKNVSGWASGEVPSLIAAPEQGGIRAARARVTLADSPLPYSFKINELKVLADFDAVLTELRLGSVDQVIFDSIYKLPPERVAEYRSGFESIGVTVVEFWVPISSKPRRVNLIRSVPSAKQQP